MKKPRFRPLLVPLATLRQEVETVKEGLRHYRSKILVGTLVTLTLPVQLVSLPTLVSLSRPSVWETKLVLAETSPELLRPVEKEVSIEAAPSRYEMIQARLAARRRAMAVPDSQVPESEKWQLAHQAAQTYGIPTQLLVAVWRVESGMGWMTDRRSPAGATGPFQFMPGTFGKYGTDGDGDGDKDIHDPRDAAYAAARLLAANGASDGDYRRALYAYNHSTHYVRQVLKMAGLEGSGN